MDENNTDINKLSHIITNSLVETSTKYKENSERSKKFSQETKYLMKRRRYMKTLTTAREKIEAVELNNLIRKKQRQDFRNFRTSTIKKVVQEGRGFKMAKGKLKSGKLQFTGVLEEDGSLTTDRERIVTRAKEFYENLYSSNRVEPVEEPFTEKKFQKFPKIEPWEVNLAVKQSKIWKAPGQDNITIDLIEAVGEEIYRKMAYLFNECITESEIPDSWNEAIVILLYKKGDPENISNYRPISLLSSTFKLFTKIITNRLTQSLNENQPREQAGFRKGFSTMDHLHAVNQLIEKCEEYKIPLAVALVDYDKAFDSAEIQDIIEALKEQEVDEAYIEVLNISIVRQNHSLDCTHIPNPSSSR